ncbi:MAG: DUF2919 family protein [Colwellia sp.]|jgi:Protein of unknown function (DUF2919).
MKGKNSIKQIKNRLSPSDFDDQGNLKPSIFTYLCFAYLCKALIITLMALTSLGHETNAIISVVYSAPITYYFDITVGLMTLIAIFIFSKRNSFTKNGLKILTKYIVKFIIPSLLLIDLSYLIVETVQTRLVFSVTVMQSLFVCYLFLTYVLSSREKVFRTQY